MKIILIALISVFSVGALACPNLEGTYLCVDQDGERTDETIKQSVNADGFTMYEFSEGDTFITDGVKRTEDVDGGTVTYSSTCIGTNLKINAFLNYPNDGFTVDIKAQAYQTTAGYSVDGTALVTFSGGSETYPVESICTRK